MKVCNIFINVKNNNICKFYWKCVLDLVMNYTFQSKLRGSQFAPDSGWTQRLLGIVQYALFRMEEYILKMGLYLSQPSILKI